MSCGDHLQWGYVDQPPLIPFLIHICRAVLGDSLRAFASFLRWLLPCWSCRPRCWPANSADAATRCCSARSASAIAPQYLSNGSLLGTNCLEPNLWMGCAYFAILAIKRNDPRYWLWFGVVAGLGMEEKYSIAVFGLGIVVGLLLTEQRRRFSEQVDLARRARRLPDLSAQPALEHSLRLAVCAVDARHSGRGPRRGAGPPQYFFQQTLLVNPLTAPIWLAGLFALLFSARLKPYRALGWCYLVCYTVFFVLHGKNYYLAPVYPMLFAAGAVMIESPWIVRGSVVQRAGISGGHSAAVAEAGDRYRSARSGVHTGSRS